MILDRSFELDLADPAATARLGAALAAILRRGDAVLLYGPLGAGKSTLARALVRRLTRPDEEVPSPTFTLVQTYDGPAFPVSHFDLYRLGGPEEVFELGLDEALDEGAALVEWPERLGARLPPDRLAIELRLVGSGGLDAGRGVRLDPHGSWKGRQLDW